MIPLKFVKFQNVQNVQFFFKVTHSFFLSFKEKFSISSFYIIIALKILQDNQGGGEVTQIDHLAIIGKGILPCLCLEFLTYKTLFFSIV